MTTVDYRTLTPDNIPTPTNKRELLALLLLANDVLKDIDRQLTKWDSMLEAAYSK